MKPDIAGGWSLQANFYQEKYLRIRNTNNQFPECMFSIIQKGRND